MATSGVNVGFWSHVAVDPDGCWLWQRATDQDGYGIYSTWDAVNRRVENQRAHRVAWQLTNRKLQSGEIVCHSCDVPTCVNPAHLFVGTQGENQADKVAKGRQARGAANGKSRFTEDQVRAIKHDLAEGVKPRALATAYGCSLSAIEHIKYGRCWAWV